MGLGILAGLAAGAFWGFTFIAPKFVPEASAISLAFGRYFCFGLISAGYLWKRRRNLTVRIDRSTVTILIQLCLSGYLLYFISLIWAVKLTGVALTSLIAGLLPLSIPITELGMERLLPDSAAERSSPNRFKRLMFPLGLIGIGISLIYIGAIPAGLPNATIWGARTLGLGVAFLSLLIWTFYALRNARYLKENPGVSGTEWTSLLGVSCLIVVSLCDLVDTLSSGKFLGGILVEPSEVLSRYFIASAALGLGASWIAGVCWNVASRRLPMVLTGQLIVSETVFALIYGFIWEHRWPSWIEVLGCLCCIGGVCWGIRRTHQNTEHS